MVDYLDLSYVHRPPNHDINPLHKCQSKTIVNDNFYLKKDDRDQCSIIMCFCSEVF